MWEDLWWFTNSDHSCKLGEPTEHEGNTEMSKGTTKIGTGDNYRQKKTNSLSISPLNKLSTRMCWYHRSPTQAHQCVKKEDVERNDDNRDCFYSPWNVSFIVLLYNVTVLWNLRPSLYHRPLNLILTTRSLTNKRLVHTKDTDTECVWTAAFILPQISKPVYMRSEIPPATTPLPPLPPQQQRDLAICEIGETWPSPGYGMFVSECSTSACVCVCVCVSFSESDRKKVLLNFSWFFKSQHMAG